MTLQHNQLERLNLFNRLKQSYIAARIKGVSKLYLSQELMLDTKTTNSLEQEFHEYLDTLIAVSNGLISNGTIGGTHV